jgi:hypothetical protein
MPTKISAAPAGSGMEQFGAGMITGWGAHHRRHHALGHEHRPTGSVRNLGHRRIPTSASGTSTEKVTHPRHLRQRHHHGHLRRLPQRHQVRHQSWIFVTRDEMTTPTRHRSQTTKTNPMADSEPKILDSQSSAPTRSISIKSDDQHGNWLQCIKTRKAPTAPAEIGHRASNLPPPSHCDED